MLLFRRLPALVCLITTHQSDKQHRLLTQYGTLNDTYRTGDLEPLVGHPLKLSVEDVDVKYVSMTEAASLANSANGSTEAVNTLCQCKTGCFQDNRCKCFKNGLKCTSHCHGKLDTGKTKAACKIKKCLNK